MYADKDNRGMMSITDITREEALTLRSAAQMLLRKMERNESPAKESMPPFAWYRAEVSNIASMGRLRNFIRAVNTFFPDTEDATVGSVSDR